MSEEATQSPWWCGTVCPTNSFRWKELEWTDIWPVDARFGGMVLQQLVTDTGGMRRRWVDVPRVWHGASDDE